MSRLVRSQFRYIQGGAAAIPVKTAEQEEAQYAVAQYATA
jgi:hypothetical protein